MRRLFRSQRGDTIVEVLVSVAALSLVLSASYALATRSSQATRQAQERSEAFKIAGSQLERFIEYLKATGDAYPEPTNGMHFCVVPDDPGNPLDPITLEIFGAVTPPPIAQTELVSRFSSFNTHPECVNGFYHTYIVRQGVAAAGVPVTYTVHTRWYAATGRGIDEATMVYRVYPDSIAEPL